MNKEQLENLDKEIEAMESAVFNREEESPDTTEAEMVVDNGEPEAEMILNPEEPVEDITEPEAEPQPEQPDLSTQEEEEDKPPEKKQRTNWKKRYSTLKQKLDATIHELRLDKANYEAEKLQFMERVEELEGTILELQKNKPKESIEDLYTQEEREVIGDEALTAIERLTNKRVQEATAPLEKKLADEAKARREAAQKRAEATQKDADTRFREALSDLVDDLEEIDTDPKFAKWLQEPNEFGGIRYNLFKKAQVSGDVERVAQFFNEYSGNRPQKIKKNMIEEQITPVGQGSTAPEQLQTSDEKPKWTVEKIDRFYDDVVRGRFKGKQKLEEQMEAEINSAIEHAMRNGYEIPLR